MLLMIFLEFLDLKQIPANALYFPIEVIQPCLICSRFTWGNFSIKFLGLPLICSRLTTLFYQPLLGGLCSRVLHWTTRFISQAGRLELVRSV